MTEKKSKFPETEMTPSAKKIKKGLRPKELTFRTVAQGGPSDRKTIITTTVFRVDYETKEILFVHGICDIGIASFPVMPWTIPATHLRDVNQVGRIILDVMRFKRLRLYGPRVIIDSGLELIVVNAKDSDGDELMEVFSEKDDVAMWELVDKVTVKEVRQVSPREARDLIAQFEYADVKKEIEREKLIKSVTPTALIERAIEMGMRVRYAVGNLMDWVAKGENAKNTLRELNLSRTQRSGAWELMYKGKVDMPSV